MLSYVGTPAFPGPSLSNEPRGDLDEALPVAMWGSDCLELLEPLIDRVARSAQLDGLLFWCLR